MLPHKMLLLTKTPVWLVLFLVTLLYAPPTVSQAQSVTPTPIPVSADQVNAIARNLYCPVCENTPLEVCPTDACIRWREQVRELLAQGETEDQVRQYFIGHFGMRTVGTPTDMTSVLLTTGLPFALLFIAGLLIGWQLWRWYRTRPNLIAGSDTASEESSVRDLSDAALEYQTRIEAELHKKG